jgi:hypothetical protein
MMMKRCMNGRLLRLLHSKKGSLPGPVHCEKGRLLGRPVLSEKGRLVGPLKRKKGRLLGLQVGLSHMMKTLRRMSTSRMRSVGLRRIRRMRGVGLRRMRRTVRLMQLSFRCRPKP